MSNIKISPNQTTNSTASSAINSATIDSSQNFDEFLNLSNELIPNKNSVKAFKLPQTSTFSTVESSHGLINADLSRIGSRTTTYKSSVNLPSRTNSDIMKLKSQNKSRQNSINLVSEIEKVILESSEPVEMDEKEEIEVLSHRGVWINKSESLNWKGVIPLSEYRINQDTNPQLITKQSKKSLEYVQELAIRYLRPPTPPTPGEILIKQEPNVLTSPAPPLIIRQQPPRPQTPKPLVIREAPPTPPQPIGRQLITISGKKIPPPPRKVIIEKLAKLPPKPQSILIERWLPYSKVKRKVIFKAAPPDPIIAKPRNTIIKWKVPEIQIKKEHKFLGVIRANPSEYVYKYGKSLKLPVDLPDFVNDIKLPDNIMLAANNKPLEYHELEGDIHALKLVNLEKEGLGAYKNYLAKLDSLENQIANNILSSPVFRSSPQQLQQRLSMRSSSPFSPSSPKLSPSQSGTLTTVSSNAALEDLIYQIFQTLDKSNLGIVNSEDAKKILSKLNERLGGNDAKNDVDLLFESLDLGKKTSLNLDEFRRAFLNIAI